MFHLFITKGGEDYTTYCGVDWVDALTLVEWLVTKKWHVGEEPCEDCLEKVCPLEMLALTDLE